jgi:hypothetical protein
VTFLTLCFLRRFSPFSHASLEIFAIVVHLLKCKSECEEALCFIGGEASREAITVERSDLGSIDIKSRFQGVEGRRTPTDPQCSSTCT